VGYPNVESVLQSPHSLFEGERLTPDEIDRAGAYLLSKALITGIRTGQTEGPVRAEITAEGQDCVEHFEGDVSAYERRNSSGNTTFNIGENAGNIAANSRDFTMNATTNKDGTEPRVSKPRLLADLPTRADSSAGADPSSASSTPPSSVERWAACSPLTPGRCFRACLPRDRSRDGA
jgi:hypothetical protein